MRTISLSLCGYRATVALPDEFFDAHGVPLWHMLNARFSSPIIRWSQPIGGVPRDEVLVVNAPQPTPIGEELQKVA